MTQRWSPSERAALIAEVRERRSQSTGYADDGWTGVHLDALMEEIDSRPVREPAKSAAEINAERIEEILKESWRVPPRYVARLIIEAFDVLRSAREDPYKEGVQDRARGLSFDRLRVQGEDEDAYGRGWGPEERQASLGGLIAMLEAATEGNAELSWAIATHLGWRKYWSGQTIYLPPGVREEDDAGGTTEAPRYTTSIEWALALKPPGAEYQISTLYGVAHVELPLNGGDGNPPQHGERKDGNVILATCIAALKARQP